MTLKILCTPKFTGKESASIDNAAKALHTTREDIVRKAVAYFSAKCVPTQGGGASHS